MRVFIEIVCVRVCERLFLKKKYTTFFIGKVIYFKEKLYIESFLSFININILLLFCTMISNGDAARDHR